MYYIKLLIITLISTIYLQANSFETNCTSCHFANQQLSSFMARYTLKYSSEKKIKKAIFDFLKNPTKDNSIMPIGFISRWGVKEKSVLSDYTLKKAIDEYYNEFKLHKKLQ